MADDRYGDDTTASVNTIYRRFRRFSPHLRYRCAYQLDEDSSIWGGHVRNVNPALKIRTGSNNTLVQLSRVNFDLAGYVEPYRYLYNRYTTYHSQFEGAITIISHRQHTPRPGYSSDSSGRTQFFELIIECNPTLRQGSLAQAQSLYVELDLELRITGSISAAVMSAFTSSSELEMNTLS